MLIWHCKKKVCKDLKYVSIKFVQANLQKCITWFKKFKREGKNGTRFVLKLAFAQKIKHFSENQVVFFVSL